MDLAHINRVYFLGIGGIGMSALARYFNSIGKDVSGFDRTQTKLTAALESEGMAIHFEDGVENIPDSFKAEDEREGILIVYTPALPDSSPELNYFRDEGYSVKKRAEVLGELANRNTSIGVAGTHGKTTVTSMIAHIMKAAGVSSNTFLGGISANYNTNHIQEADGELVIAEADEYDRSFLFLNPNTAVVTSIDADHLDIYDDHSTMTESYIDFTNNVINGGIVLLSDKVLAAIGERVNPYAATLSYSIEGETDYFAKNIAIQSGAYKFDVRTPNGTLENVELSMGGRHNIENAVAAIAVAENHNVSHESIRSALGSYKGVKRRFEVICQSPSTIYIDDYAHHPNEVSSALESVKELYPDKKLTVLFQPHLFTRTRDFAEEFGKSLSIADRLFLLDIYPAREEPIEGVTSELILEHVQSGEKGICTKEEAIEKLKLNEEGVFMTLGAGDIDQLVEPISRSIRT